MLRKDREENVEEVMESCVDEKCLPFVECDNHGKYNASDDG